MTLAGQDCAPDASEFGRILVQQVKHLRDELEHTKLVESSGPQGRPRGRDSGRVIRETSYGAMREDLDQECRWFPTLNIRQQDQWDVTIDEGIQE